MNFDSYIGYDITGKLRNTFRKLTDIYHTNYFQKLIFRSRLTKLSGAE